MERIKDMNIKKLKGMALEQFATYPLEADRRTNQISRAIIRAYKSNGKAYVGKVNGYEGMTEYKSGKVHNFKYDFVVPCADADLDSLLRAWNTTSFYDMTKTGMTYTIYDRINDIGGTYLTWS
jgi:hypothetical protein